MIKQPSGALNPWDFSVEPGCRVFEPFANSSLSEDCYYISDIIESGGIDKRKFGELTPRRVMKNGKPRVGKEVDGVWYWLEESN
jgi:hypothetical protein